MPELSRAHRRAAQAQAVFRGLSGNDSRWEDCPFCGIGCEFRVGYALVACAFCAKRFHYRDRATLVLDALSDATEKPRYRCIYQELEP